METVKDYIIFEIVFDREIKKIITCNSSIKRSVKNISDIVPMNSNSCKYNVTPLECLAFEDVQEAIHVSWKFLSGERLMEIILVYETGKPLPFVPFLFKQGFPVRVEPEGYNVKVNTMFAGRILVEITAENHVQFFAIFNEYGKSFDHPELSLSMEPLDNNTLYLPFSVETYNEDTDKVITIGRRPVRIYATDINNSMNEPVLAVITLNDGTEETALYGKNGRDAGCNPNLLIHENDLFIQRELKQQFNFERMIQGYPIVTKSGLKAIPTTLDDDNGTFTADIYLQGEVVEATYDKTGNIVEEDNDDLTLIMEDCGNMKLEPFDIQRYLTTRQKAVTRSGLKLMELHITQRNDFEFKTTYAKVMTPDGREIVILVDIKPDEEQPKLNDLLLISENTVLN